jgi:hypothetical protein
MAASGPLKDSRLSNLSVRGVIVTKDLSVTGKVNGMQFPHVVTTLNGTFQNASSPPGTRYCHWGANANPLSTNPVYIPYECEIVALSISYSHPFDPIAIPVDESLTFDIGFPSPDIGRELSNFNAVPGTSIVWSNATLGSVGFPQSNLALSVPVPANTLLSVRVTETDNVIPEDGDVTVIIWLKGKFLPKPLLPVESQQ